MPGVPGARYFRRVSRRSPAPLLLLACALLSIASVFGHDERQAPGAGTRQRFQSVGLLYAPGHEADGGTATLVTPTRILSAGHVLFDSGGRLRRPLSAYRFRLGDDFVHNRYRDLALAQIVGSGRNPGGLDSTGEDWVVLELATPLADVAPSSLLPADTDDLARPQAQAVQMTAFHSDVGQGMRRVTTSCRTLARGPGRAMSDFTRELVDRGDIVLHDCDSAGLSSGAGLFVRREGRSLLAALNIGKLGPARAKAPSLRAEHYNVAISIGKAMRRAIASPPPVSTLR